MNIKSLDIKKITPYEYNPRDNKEAIDIVARSIQEFGFKNPILVDENNVIICGHTRYYAALQLDMTYMPCIIDTDLNEEQKRAYRIADNKTAEYATWDYEILAKELGEIDIDLSWLDFDLDVEIDEVAEIVDDEYEYTLPESPFSKTGDLWLLNNHRLLCGDSTNDKDMARLMDYQIAAMSFTDPPWNVAIGTDNVPGHKKREGLKNDNLSEEDFLEFLEGFLRVLKPYLTGDLYCVLGAKEWPSLDGAIRKNGFHWSDTIVWVKDSFVMGRSKYHHRYEPIWYGWPDKIKSSFRAGRNQDNVWDFPRPKKSDEHPTMKPVELVAKAIKNSSIKKSIVADQFAGSGTTFIAGDQLERFVYGMEIDPRFIDVIVKRYVEYKGSDAEVRLIRDGKELTYKEATAVL